MLKSLTIQIESSNDEANDALIASAWQALCGLPAAACLLAFTTQNCSVIFKMDVPVAPYLVTIMQILTTFHLRNLWRKEGGMPQWNYIASYTKLNPHSLGQR